MSSMWRQRLEAKIPKRHINMKPSISASKVDLTMKNGLTVLTSPPPPPPPQLPTPKKGRKMVPALIAIALIAIILVATVVALYFNIIRWPFNPVDTTQPTNYGVVMGKVTDLTNNPVSNVKVSVGDQNSTTTDQGWFSISNVTAGSKELITFRKKASV